MDSIEISDETKVLLIAGIPKSLSWKKLKNIVTKHADDSLTLQLIPQDSYNILEVTSSTKAYERLLKTPCVPLSMLNNDINIYPISSCVSNDAGQHMEVSDSILDLNYDCLRKIFEYCTPKDQIVIGKVCRHFYETIRDIWCGKSRKFVYNPYRMEFEQKLSNENIKEIFALLGNHVDTLRYNTIFYFPMIQRYLSDFSGNMVNLARKLVNINLCRHLMYLENVTVFEVEGKFITDFTVRELARYCKQLRTFRLMDTDVRFLRGNYLYLLSNLEELHIRECKSFSCYSLIRVCKSCNIKSLDIVDCECLQEPKFIQELCQLVPNLETFKLSAQINDDVLTAVLSLKNLRFLEFYWPARDKMNFEVVLLKKLSELSANNLKRLTFVNDLIAIDNQSMQPEMSHKKYAELREKTAASGREWNLNEKFDEIMKLFAKLVVLENITFEYCRPFSQDNLLKLQEGTLNLKLVNIIGCSTKEDLKTKKAWDERSRGIIPEENCQLHYEALIPADQVEQIQQRVSAPVRNDSHYTPTLRSIQCCFDVGQHELQFKKQKLDV